MISFQHITHAYGDAVSVDDVSLTVEPGAVTALIGPSGCGKSTLLKLAIGLLTPRAGRIEVGGREVNAASVQEIRRATGYVIQSGGLFPHLTCEENITLAARRLGRAGSWIEARMDELAELVRLPREVLQRLPHDVSGGQRQRVSLMRALMLDPQVLLLDEPLGALDPMVRYSLQEDLSELFARLRKSVLLVTHDLAEAAFFSDHLALMCAGRIVQQGAYGDLIESPANEFVNQFVRAQRTLRAAAHA